MQEEKGVIINGIRWATRNVGAPGTFVENPEDYGEYYTWEEAKNACPKGWRLPAKSEFLSLKQVGSVWTSINDITGRIFNIVPNQKAARFRTLLVGIASEQIFFPAGGWYVSDDETLIDVGIFGGYWGSTRHSINLAIGLRFLCNSVNTDWYWQERRLFVRCVAEN